MHLKRKKLYEKQCATAGQAMLNLETQIISLEGASMNQDVFEGMQTANTAFKQVNAKMDMDKVDDVRDDLEDALDMQNEIGEALGGAIGNQDGLDEDDLLAELDAEFAQEEQVAAQDMMQDMPAVPGHALPGVAAGGTSMVVWYGRVGGWRGAKGGAKGGVWNAMLNA